MTKLITALLLMFSAFFSAMNALAFSNQSDSLFSQTPYIFCNESESDESKKPVIEEEEEEPDCE